MRAHAILNEWRANPCRFVWDNFGVEPDAWQKDVLEALANPSIRRIGMQACAGPGKSAVLAWAGWLMLACYADKDHHPNGAAVSITRENLKTALWKELATWRGRCEWIRTSFEFTSERIYEKNHKDTWFLDARGWTKSADAEEIGRTLSGLHSKYIFYLIDEGGDIPPAILRSAEQGMGNCAVGKILLAGNPTSHDGILYKVVTDLRDQWYVVRITGDPDDAKRSPRINIDWARDQIRQYGRDNAWVMAYVLGLFPPGSMNKLLSPDEVSAAMGRHLKEEDYQWAQKRLGIDVARFGDDSTIIFPRQGLAAFKPVKMRNARTNEIAARVMIAKSKWQSEMEVVDDTGGWGAGVIDSMIMAGNAPLPINFSGKALDSRFFNKRAEMWWSMAEWVKRGGALPKDEELAKELCAPTYTFHNGKIQIEEKEQIKKRLQFSPDKADALCLTFAIPDQPKAVMLVPGQKENSTHLSEYDPFV